MRKAPYVIIKLPVFKIKDLDEPLSMLISLNPLASCFQFYFYYLQLLKVSIRFGGSTEPAFEKKKWKTIDDEDLSPNDQAAV